MLETACEISGLEKSFGPNRVLRGIGLTLPRGSVTVLMGANGAGKSTLVKILCGIHQKDAGTMRLFGQTFEPLSPRDAFRAGIVTVHQSINDGVAPDLDVASNLMLDRLTEQSGFFVSKRAIRSEARKISERMKLSLDVTQPVSSLGVADRQMIAIARAMARDPKLLILDEPTSSLSASEADRLFELIDHLRDTGVSILYISHRMSDIRRIANRIVSMRDGQISGVFEGDALDYEAAVAAMLGHRMTEVDVRIDEPGDDVLCLDRLRLVPDGAKITLTARKNEVIAITGLLGSGKTQLASILFGLSEPASGHMTLNGKPYQPRTAGDAIRAGVYMCPKDRASNAVVPDFNIANNLTLPFLGRYSSLSFLNAARQSKAARGMIETLGIVCQSPLDGIGTLSGGNQQKVMVGRWLSDASHLLVLDEPFQGVDIQARRDIGAHIRATASERATIVFVAEIDEALEIADRILVMTEHALVGEHRNENINLGHLHSQISGQGSVGIEA